MYIEMTRLVPVEDLPEPLRRFLAKLPNLIVQATVDANVDKPHQDWAIRFTWLGESIKLCYSDRPDLGMWCETYPSTVGATVVVPARDAPPEDWAAFVKVVLRIKLERDLQSVRRKLDRLG